MAIQNQMVIFGQIEGFELKEELNKEEFEREA
jgi:hypothetical protein